MTETRAKPPIEVDEVLTSISRDAGPLQAGVVGRKAG